MWRTDSATNGRFFHWLPAAVFSVLLVGCSDWLPDSEDEGDDIRQSDTGGGNGGNTGGSGGPANPSNPTNPYTPSPSKLQYTEKTNGSLDYMGVKVTRTNSSQKLWHPGAASQEYPGGWVTPGDYVLSINTARIHHHKDGTLTGQTRSGHQLMGVITSRTLTDPGWTNHGFYDPSTMKPQAWGSTKTVTLKAGDTLHVAYGNKIVDWQKRNGSDGIVVHCVSSTPLPRGGLWGTGDGKWSTAKWALLVARIKEASKLVTPGNQGPGSIPNPIPSDFGMKTGDQYDNRQGFNISNWLLARGMASLKGQNVDKAEMLRLLDFYCNNVQLCFAWSDTSAEHYFYAHGFGYYPPYAINQITNILPAAVALGLDPNYEPLYRMLSHLAQRPDMTLSHAGSYTYGNHAYDGGLSNHRDDNNYTKWLWYTLGIRDLLARGSHRHKVWGPCVWARDLMGWPMTTATQQCLWNSGNKVVPHGHEWTSQGVGAGFNEFYANLEVEGAAFLWFAGSYTNSQFNRWARRNYLYTNYGAAHYYTKWCQDTFVNEPKGLSGGIQGTSIKLIWIANQDSDLHSYRVYRGTQSGQLSLHWQDITATQHIDSSVGSGQTYYYAITAVDKDGNESSLSDEIQVKT